MNIHTVVENLKNTIKGKEAYLASDAIARDTVAGQVLVSMLELNINELKVILHDCEKCAEQYSLMTWEINPDRMGQ
jgi:hypothetical protein